MANDAALKEKEQGNAAYKAKNFTKAIEHYEKVNKVIFHWHYFYFYQLQAIELDPTEITFYNNIAAVCFEKEEYGACIKTCETAIEIGKEHRADCKLMAKAYNRAGKAFRKMGNLSGAEHAFELALTEHRTPEYRANLSEVKIILKI